MSSDIKSLEEEQSNLIDKLNSPTRELAFLFGAGTSVPAKLPDMFALTKCVEESLEKTKFKKVFGELKGHLSPIQHIEHVLSFLEEIVQIDGFAGVIYPGGKAPHDWNELISEIKKCIVNTIEDKVDLESTSHHNFSKWIRSRESQTEIYTTNYDLVLETAFENSNVFYFDGFVGGIRPIFQAATVDPVTSNASTEVRPPKTWIRLWKMHGSINWETDISSGKLEVRRNPSKIESCLIYPSSAKYSDSRRMPFVVLQDKFRRALTASSCTLVVLGYGFGDQHLNETVFDAIESNRSLDVNILSYVNLDKNPELSKLNDKKYPNVTIFTPDSFYHQGGQFKWEDSKVCSLGDASYFFEELLKSINFQEPIV